MKRKNAGTSLFLMEMIIIVLFFSIACAVCVQAFVNAHLLDKHTMELNHAVIAAQGFADVMRGSDGTLESLLAAYPDAVIKEGNEGLQVFYDREFHPIGKEGNTGTASYCSDITLTSGDRLHTIRISVRNMEDETEIYALNATKFTGLP
ncbi:MAG: hypothetical protein K6G83_15250 [Lachnospiraceae bacterium]|nr:hypothetical protein [Lachnospiraceae bacterium]